MRQPFDATGDAVDVDASGLSRWGLIRFMIEDLPTTRPDTPLLDTVSADLSALSDLGTQELVKLADELRHDLLYSVAGTGGHFGAGLGVVELTVALHHVFNTPHDRIVWDVGHQTYPHKILTGRRERMTSMRQLEGLSGFQKDQKPSIRLVSDTPQPVFLQRWAWRSPLNVRALIAR